MKNNDQIIVDDLPVESTRSDWARRLGVPLRKLVYEDRMGRLKGRRLGGYNVYYSRDAILEWVTHYGTKWFTLENN